jgi:hypothetical protein
VQLFDHVAKRGQGRLGTGGKGAVFQQFQNRAPDAQLMVVGELLDLLDAGLAEPASRCIDDAQQADGIVRTRDDLQVGKDVFDFRALVKAEAAHNDVLAAIATERFFDLPRLEVGAV